MISLAVSSQLQALDMGLLQVFACSILGNSEETVCVGVGVGSMEEENPSAV